MSPSGGHHRRVGRYARCGGGAANPVLSNPVALASGSRPAPQVLLNLVAQLASKRLDDLTANDLAAHLDAPALRRAAAAYLEIVAPRLQGKRKSRVVDKTPANYYFLPLIRLIFPSAHFVLVRRVPTRQPLEHARRGHGSVPPLSR